ncbi:kinesin-like protein Klp98A isoform X1 [Pararge aegeria]|uniref:kinesin-like protein Klp98A isoform X1 n=1 Tax=Pararge aegeria TaxID=116150 RepID=UPI0019D19C50|nr:kinesin-like protein Klp98A isoform X1 [Pararge aegeria]
MASVKVAVRVRPFNQREKDMNAKLIVQMEAKKTRLLTVKNSKEQNDGSREKYKDFTFDHSYWSYDSADAQYASQEQVFADLGLDVIDSAFEGYNACVFAYGQTGSGKTFTMMGSPDSQGLIPRICRQLFSRVAAGKESGASYRTEVSYLEIYNERVKDLLATDAGHSLRVREHPKLGPYVQDLSRHLVSDYDDIQECMHRGNLHRTTASTQMNDVSSRSHAIFTITFVQASYLRHNNMPSETVSKVHLVDLAGSERADATGATGQRLVEGAHINKSLVTLGSVISALAEATQIVDSRNAKNKKNVFIPYRDSVLTWLLKDSLGGNSKTIMIAAISPADCNYGETLSTLRYANRAKNIINKPTINEDPNVKLIRELREEIDKLRAQISHNTDQIEMEPAVLATLQRKEAQEKVLTEKWTEKWRETQQILQEQKALGLRKSGLGVVLDSDMPHLVGIDDNLLSTGVTLYHLKEGETLIGSEEFTPTPDIVLTGAGVLPLHCRVTLREGVATITPASGAQCWLNTVLLDKPAKLSQGCILLLGRTNMFRYNDPAEAAKLRQEGASVMNLSRLSLLSWSTTDLAASTENLNTTLSDLESEIRCERIEAQRAELERERQQFELQQEERQRRWHQEREQLLQAQRQLDEERSAMEKEYAAACRRLSGDWRTLERGWTLRRRALRCRQRELSARVTRHAAAAREVIDTIEKEEGQITDLRRRLGGKQDDLEQFVREKLKELVKNGCKIDESVTPSPDDSPPSETSTESLMHLLQQCEPNTAKSIKETVERHKKELESLEQELQGRVASVAAHRVKIERLQKELAVLAARERGITRALADGEGEIDMSPTEGVKRSKSELVLRSRTEVPEPLSADEREHFRDKRLSLSLSLDPLPSPSSSLNTPETFHTATSSPKHQSSSSVPTPSTTETSALPSDPAPVPQFRLGVAPDDSDDMSSTEDYHKPRIVEGQSSSSVERSPEERQQRTKYRRRIGESKNRRQVTEAEALRAMQRLCSRIASQKMLVISCLENDCSKEELNRQIAVLQELQKKYVRLEMALQYSFFDNQPNKRTIMVTPIQETPSLTLSESDMQVSNETAPASDTQNGHFDDPLLSRLKETEVEASDNVSTSNDELPSEPWPDPLRALCAPTPHRTDHEHEQNHRQDAQHPLPDNSEGLMHPVDFADVVSLPGWVTRGAGARTHHEYEVRVRLPNASWALLRRYRRFRDLYLAARTSYGEKVAAIPFPARTLWSSEALARSRRSQLETFLRRLLTVCSADRRCPLYASPLTRESLVAFSPFFRKVFLLLRLSLTGACFFFITLPV